MRALIRKASAWMVALSLVDGLLLPFVATPVVADPDGACGPVFVLEHSIEHFEPPIPAESDHCAVCHLWNALASASTSTRAVLTPPADDGIDAARLRLHRVDLSLHSKASPRGPPALA